jgi:predicted metal-dependent enzyme (double-stranded beta helix superfamily)
VASLPSGRRFAFAVQPRRSSGGPDTGARPSRLGLVGLYRGTQDEEIYAEGGAALELRERRALREGDFYSLIPPRDDIHRVRTTSPETSVSIHLLTNDTGCVWRHAYDPDSGEARPFRSGYVNVPCEDDD